MTRAVGALILGASVFFACPKAPTAIDPVVVYRNLSPCLPSYPPEAGVIAITECDGPYVACLTAGQYTRLASRLQSVRLWIDLAVLACGVRDAGVEPDAGILGDR